MSTASPSTETLYYGDCLRWMESWPEACVDLIYLDPPFNSKAKYSVLYGGKLESNARHDVRYVAFDDNWHWDAAAARRYARIEDAAGHAAQRAVVACYQLLGPSGMLSYLVYMAERLVEMWRLLRPRGSLYLHCNQHASHYLKILMDALFGGEHFVNEIVWNYGTPSGGRASGKKPVKVSDSLLVYAREPGQQKYHRQYTPYSEDYIKRWFRHRDTDGRAYQTRSRRGAAAEDDKDGRAYRTRSRGGKIVRQYLDASAGVPLSNVWSDIKQLYGSTGWFPRKNPEHLGYPTQKPLALLERVVRMASDEGDVVLDPFCGCGTTIEAAQRLKRRWMGIDISLLAIDLIKDRRLKDANIRTEGISR